MAKPEYKIKDFAKVEKFQEEDCQFPISYNEKAGVS